ncbi:hypothetical protein [Nocardia sp. NPDC057030]|uniref:hypothetical protein n=1 Tax=unclassified Nocardia TaxID=2637762 RepID=UPI00362E11CF
MSNSIATKQHITLLPSGMNWIPACFRNQVLGCGSGSTVLRLVAAGKATSPKHNAQAGSAKPKNSDQPRRHRGQTRPDRVPTQHYTQ